MTDEGAGAAFAETYADLQGTRVVLAELTPLIRAQSPSLLPAVGAQMAALRTALLATRADGQWRSLAGAPLAARQRADAATGALLETAVPDLLEAPPPR